MNGSTLRFICCVLLAWVCPSGSLSLPCDPVWQTQRVSSRWTFPRLTKVVCPPEAFQWCNFSLIHLVEAWWIDKEKTLFCMAKNLEGVQLCGCSFGFKVICAQYLTKYQNHVNIVRQNDRPEHLSEYSSWTTMSFPDMCDNFKVIGRTGFGLHVKLKLIKSILL